VTPEDVWRAKSNEDLIAASHRLSDYTEVGQQVIAAELLRRRESGMMSGEDSTDAPEEVTPVPHGYVRRLWHGYVPLFITYWGWGVLGNVVWGVVGAFAAAARMPLLFMIVVFLNLAYAVFVSIAIWRSAGRYSGKRIWAELARISVAANMARAMVNLIFGG
jgi:hypothetical protein